jgi:hypothetical protein
VQVGLVDVAAFRRDQGGAAADGETVGRVVEAGERSQLAITALLDDELRVANVEDRGNGHRPLSTWTVSAPSAVLVIGTPAARG